MSKGNRYWKVTGDVAKQVRAILDRRDAVFAAIREIVAREGASGSASYTSFGQDHFVFVFAFASASVPPKIAAPKDWKKWQPKSEFFVPRENTKRGKELAVEIDEIEKRVSAGEELCKAIGMKFWGGLGYQTPGATRDGKKTYVATPADYLPPAALAGQIKRVSDIEWDKVAKVEEEDDE